PWPRPTNPRPLLLWHPEPVHAPATPELPETFRWRGMDLKRHRAIGPERIAPEWWLDDPNWRSGTRDYWIADTEDGQRLWLFYAHGAAMSSGWFCQGSFA
ncbi:DNA polymerase Y family protein, partial [Synechococcus sp. MU1644]|nr:DNA polymerase Y family protein [Synechococcus sp. MU1644]